MMIYNKNKIDQKGKFVKLLSRTTICKNVVRDETLQKCCPELKFANFMTKYDPQGQFASILSRKTICKECFLEQQLAKMLSATIICICKRKLQKMIQYETFQN